jgi:hypothetical protein
VKIKHIPLIACALAALATGASAQFTTSMAPPREKAKVDTVAKRDSVRAATVALAARVTDMKQWVDSAAGVVTASTDSGSSVASGLVERAKAPSDSVARSRDEKMRADSASVIATVEVHDSTGLTASTPDSAHANRETTRFAAGAPAPGTATALPLVALLGVTTLLVGAALRRP